MEIKQIENSKLKMIITSFIVSDKFCEKIFPILIENKELIINSFINYYKIILDWILDYYKKYSKAPHEQIQLIYESNKNFLEEEDRNFISTFLSLLSDNFTRDEKYNEDFVIDLTLLYLRETNLNILTNKISDAKRNNQIDEAEQFVRTYDDLSRSTEIRQSTMLFTDMDTAEKICDNKLNENENENDKLFKLKGELGDKLGWIYREDFFSINGVAKLGKCQSGDSMVLLYDGSMKTLKEICDNKQNYNLISLNESGFKLEKDKISDFMYLGKKECVRIITKTGRYIDCALTHPFLHFSKGWIKSEFLKIGDYICMPKKTDFFGNGELKDYEIKLIAYLIADGGLTTSSFIFTKQEKDIKNDFRKCVSELGDKYTEVTCLSDNIIRTNKKQKSNIELLFEKHNIKKCKSIFKEIPDIIFTLKKDKISLFLNTLFTCDGSVFLLKSCAGIQYSSGSKTMIYQIQSLLLRFGILSKIRSKKVKGFSHIYWVLDIFDKENILSFLNEIGFSFSKNKKSLELKEFIKNTRDNFSFIDGYPFEMREVLYQEIMNYKIKNESLYKEIIKNKTVSMFLHDRKRKVGIKKYTVIEINKLIQSKLLTKYLESDIFWDKIDKIECLGLVECYDLTIDKNHNYIANNFITHNSFVLREITLNCKDYGLNVIIFNLEMSHNKYLRNFYQNISGEVKQVKEGEEKVKVRMPYFELNNFGKYDIKYEEVSKYGLNGRKIKSVLKKEQIKRKGNVAIESFASNTLTFQKMCKILDEYAINGFVADVVLIDFLDNLRVIGKNSDYRHEINQKWTEARRLAQMKHIAVGTVSHTNKGTFKKNITAGDVSEDSRKEQHITHMIGLNQTPEEKEKQIMRVNIIHSRDEDFNRNQFFICLECRSIGRVLIDSMDSNKVNYKIKE